MDLKELELTQTNHGRHPWELARFEVVWDLFKQEFRNINFDAELHILDLGCGDTWFAEQLSKKLPYAKIYAVDTAFSDVQIQHLNNKYQNSNIKVFRELDELNNLGISQIDLVLLLDVIEHIADDIAFMSWLKGFKFINKKTCSFITVPAYESLFCEHDRFLEHYRRYTNSMLKEHLERAGWNTQKKGYFFLSLLPIRVLEVLNEKLLKRKKEYVKGIGGWKADQLKDKILVKVLVNDYSIGKYFRKLGLNLPGLSNFAVCRIV